VVNAVEELVEEAGSVTKLLLTEQDEAEFQVVALEVEVVDSRM
jgi:hypothetical protein